MYKIDWIIELHGDGQTKSMSLPIATSPVFSAWPLLDSSRNQRPTGVVITEISGGPDSYCPSHSTKTVTHRPMIDEEIEVEGTRVDEDGKPILDDKGRKQLVVVKRKTGKRIEGPEVTEVIPIREGESPPLPVINARVQDGVLFLEFNEPIIDGQSIGVVGAFTYELGASK